MPRTVEHLVETATIARQRRAAGKPSWISRLDVSDIFHNDELCFEEKRDAAVARIKRTGWYKGEDEFSDLHDAVANLADAEDEDEFDGWWDEIYDLADYARVWISTF